MTGPCDPARELPADRGARARLWRMLRRRRASPSPESLLGRNSLEGIRFKLATKCRDRHLPMELSGLDCLRTCHLTERFGSLHRSQISRRTVPVGNRPFGIRLRGEAPWYSQARATGAVHRGRHSSTNGGKTYAFTLMPGIRSSTGSVVQPRYVRASIERLVQGRLALYPPRRGLSSAPLRFARSRRSISRGAILVNRAARTSSLPSHTPLVPHQAGA